MTHPEKILEFVPTLPRFFPAAQQAMLTPLFSHRSTAFDTLYRTTAAMLPPLLGLSGFTAILCAGTGTFANELLVWNYAAAARRPLALCNGEFGQRLFRQCRSCRADALGLDFGWGAPFDANRLAAILQQHPEIDLLLAVATETSTGMMNDLALLDRLAKQHGIKIVLDGVSALGTRRDWEQFSAVIAISGSSGKALAALPGIAIVLLHPDTLPEQSPEHRPYALDLSAILTAVHQPGAVRNTLSSLLLSVLAAAGRDLAELGPDRYILRLRDGKARLIKGLAECGITPLPGSDSPMITAFRRPSGLDWEDFSRRLNRSGFGIYHRPAYLAERELFEIATMGDFPPKTVNALLRAFQTALRYPVRLKI